MASLGPLHRAVAACLRTCFWRDKQALETRSASAAAALEKVGRWWRGRKGGRSVCVCDRERGGEREREGESYKK